ncbi:MAG: hypothetical protein RLZZ522_1244, partial [Verrucomicrobiota bacterium]
MGHKGHKEPKNAAMKDMLCALC